VFPWREMEEMGKMKEEGRNPERRIEKDNKKKIRREERVVEKELEKITPI
jgi:hypothetical protein